MRALHILLFSFIINTVLFGQDSFKTYLLKDSSINVSLPSIPEEKFDTLQLNNSNFNRYTIGSKKYDRKRSIAFIIQVIDFSNCDSESQTLKYWEDYLVKNKLSKKARLTESYDMHPVQFPYTKELFFIDEEFSGLIRARLIISGKKFYSVETISFKRLANLSFRLTSDEQVFYNSFRLVTKN